MTELLPLIHLDPKRFETPVIFKKLAQAGRQLAELKGLAKSMPNTNILIDSLSMQEAKDSSAIENIVTTHDELFKDNSSTNPSTNPAIKEVRAYRFALETGFNEVKKNNLLTNNVICTIQAALEANNAGFRKLPGTNLRNNFGDIVYTPPQDPATIITLMSDLEKFINDDELFECDPLIKMALIHYQFESIHPFYDGNGRTGRIMNILYLVKENLLDIPNLYLSRYIIQNKSDYYRLLQSVRDNDSWEEWILYMLSAIEETASHTIKTIHAISKAFLSIKRQVRTDYKFYTHDLINHLFQHPYTKIDLVAAELNVNRLTAVKYLEELVKGDILQKQKAGRINYYINHALTNILINIEKKGA